MTSQPKSYKDGYHFNSSHWRNYRMMLPPIGQEPFEIAIGMLLGDASIYKTSIDAHIKFEQGYKQQAFIEHLFGIFKDYCFAEKPDLRFVKSEDGKNILKSLRFKTLSHPSFTQIMDIFYDKVSTQSKDKPRRKTISHNSIYQYLTSRGLAYWIMCDGSLQNDSKTMILHTQGFTETENIILSSELNIKFGLHTKVIPHKHKYYVIKTEPKDAACLFTLIKPYIIDSMKYKLPKIS